LPGVSPRIWFDAVLAERGLESLAMSAGIAFRSGTLPDLHNDPADRVIVATAMEYHLTILTLDELISQYPGVEVVWDG
jgi:PIN domain nuclease of toxin-antitoxin system